MLLRSAVLLVISCLLHRQVNAASISNDLPASSTDQQPSPAPSEGAMPVAAEPMSEDKDESLQHNRVVTSDVLKQMMWKKCANKGYMTCMKLAMVQMVDRMDQGKGDVNYQILPGITIIHSSDTNPAATQDILTRNTEAISKNNISEVLDHYLMGKVTSYLENLSLKVKILDDNVVSDMKQVAGNDVQEASEGDMATGRAKSGKKGGNTQFLMAALASGATLMAMAFKTIALLAGKALITSLISLAIAAAAAFKGHHHSEPKSTTYEIVTKPIVTHTDAHHGSSGGHGGHGSHDGLEQGYATYKRSIDTMGDANVDKVVYRIHTSVGTDAAKTPVYIPIETAAARR